MSPASWEKPLPGWRSSNRASIWMPNSGRPWRRHTSAPRPQLAAGRLLAAQGLATAAIDTSDGVASDLYHVCRASGVGAVIPAAAVPISPRVLAAAPYLRADPLKLALMGGEDYLLLFTAGREMVPRLSAAFPRAGLPPPLLLGEIVAGDRVSLVTAGGEVDISGAGFDHFRLDLKQEIQLKKL